MKHAFATRRSGLGSGVAKTALQEAFGEYGHIIKIETPAGAKGTAYISFQEKRDAQDTLHLQLAVMS